MDNVRAIQKIVADSLKGTDDRTLTIPEHLKEATAGLDECMVGIAEAFDRMNMKGFKRFLHRREIKGDAEECASKVATALQLFQVRVFHFEPMVVSPLLSTRSDEAADQGCYTDG